MPVKYFPALKKMLHEEFTACKLMQKERAELYDEGFMAQVALRREKHGQQSLLPEAGCF